ncbi:MAG TPA: hypothetical protein VEH58_00150 [Dehalococcoidales bacterium]|nr:hypothetical protein [Dehalococcoidales bacterium]
METRDMIIEVVYETKEGLFPLEIAASVEKKYGVHLTTRDVEKVIDKNKKLFVEEKGKFKSPDHY